MVEEKIQEKTDTTETNVKCSFCGNDTICEPCKKQPENLARFEHMCYECYVNVGTETSIEVKEKTHFCIPQEKLNEQFERFLDDTTHKAFIELWTGEKKKLKELSKQELAQTAFFEGARFMFHLMQRMSQDNSSEKKHE